MIFAVAAIHGRHAQRGGDGPWADPLWRQAERAAPQARRREGLKPNGRDGKGRHGAQSESPAVRCADTPCMCLYRSKLFSSYQAMLGPNTSGRQTIGIAQRCIGSTASRRNGRGAVLLSRHCKRQGCIGCLYLHGLNLWLRGRHGVSARCAVRLSGCAPCRLCRHGHSASIPRAFAPAALRAGACLQGKAQGAIPAAQSLAPLNAPNRLRRIGQVSALS